MAISRLKKRTLKRLGWLMDQLKAHPHKYDQEGYCGTQGCLAGYCLPKVFKTKDIILPSFLDFLALRDKARAAGKAPASGYANDFASAYLGITGEQASRLFLSEWEGEAAKFNRRPSDTDRKASNRAIKRIEAFISSNGEI